MNFILIWIVVSTFYEGEQMVRPFNLMNVDVSCLGNHELDMGAEKAKELIAKTSCPWIITNLLDTTNDDKPFLDLKPFHVAKHQGFTIGFLGFAEKEWLDCLSPEIDLTTIKFDDFNESLRKYSKILKEDHGCDLVIAINHMRVPNDQKMAAENNADVVDLVFGGHDHTYFVELNQDTGVHITKSASDFECFTNLSVLFGVEKSDFEAYKSTMEAVLKGTSLTAVQKEFPI